MKNIAEYVEAVTSAYPAIREVWLIGSRANGTARDDSDWDLLAFADGETLEALRTNQQLHASEVDLLVVDSHTGAFEKPWGVKRKKGSLERWKWQRHSDTEATYESHRWIPDQEQKRPGSETGEWEDLKLKAHRLWPLE